jgi:hypothetical protein
VNVVSEPRVQTRREVKSRRAVQVHNPVANTWLVHEDHPDQLEWLDEVRLLTKGRAGRNGKDFGRRGGNCAEVLVWRFDIVRELVNGTCGEGMGAGIIAYPGHEGALRLFRRFVLPRQGFWGRTMGFDQREGKIYCVMGQSVWEAAVMKAPAYFGLKSRPPKDLCPAVEGQPDVQQWEQLARVAVGKVGNKVQLIACAVSPSQEFVVASGEDGVLVGFRRLDKAELVVPMQP